MRSKFIPVVLTAALTSVATLYIAGRMQERIPYFAEAPSQKQLPVNYARFTDGTVSKSTPAVDFQNAAEASTKAVVHVKTQIKARTVAADDVFGRMFGQQYYMPPQVGSGSGVVISPDGYIVTNNHVVAGADAVTVTFNDRLTSEAKVVSTDASTDIAVLKVNEKNLPYMEFGNSDDVRLGQWVLAVGYPLTLDATVTAGIVSAKGRSIGINRTQSASAIESFIQTDAAVNPGNSGGALVNTDGQLIGINSAIASPTGSYAGYSYAIPSNIVRKVVNDLVQFGSVQRGYLGIEYLDRKTVSPQKQKELGIDRTEGIYIAGVLPDGGAAKSGLQKGDFITAINGQPVNTEPELMEQIARYKPGDNLSVTYLRNGNTKTTTVSLKKQTNEAIMLGASFKSLTAEEKKKYGINGGVVVSDVGKGALAKQTQMKNGFVILNVNDQPVGSVAELQGILASQAGNIQLGGFYPGARGMYYYGISNNALSGNEQ